MSKVVKLPDVSKPIEIDRQEMIEAIKNCSEGSAVYVGCDSKAYMRRGRNRIAYVTVVVIHYDQNNGGRIFKEVTIQDDYISAQISPKNDREKNKKLKTSAMRMRLMNEVYMAVDLALEVRDVVGNREFQVHLDLNPNEKHKSSIVVKEACGYVLASLGFSPELKPNSIASSTCADKYAVDTAANQQTRTRKGKHKKKSRR